MGKRLRSRILEHLKNYYYERLAQYQITEELVHTLTLNALMTMIVNEMRNLIFLVLGLCYGKYPCGEFKDIFDIRIYRLNGGRHDVVPGTPEEYKNLYTECWDNDSEKRPASEECYCRLLNIMGN